MVLRSCRDCANFEERRDIDDAVLCEENRGPFVCCEDFEPRDERINEDRLFSQFCLECTNFDEVNETAVCAKNHVPGVACEAFTDRYDELRAIKQTHLMESALLTYIIKHSNESPPASLIEAGQKIILLAR